jgi:hypothetical protein
MAKKRTDKELLDMFEAMGGSLFWIGSCRTEGASEWEAFYHYRQGFGPTARAAMNAAIDADKKRKG